MSKDKSTNQSPSDSYKETNEEKNLKKNSIECLDTLTKGDQTEQTEQTEQTDIPNDPKKLTEIAADWHIHIAKELEHPILPEDSPEEALMEILDEIYSQKEKHEKFANALNTLISINSNEQNNQERNKETPTNKPQNKK